jgi:hypothetical protein
VPVILAETERPSFFKKKKQKTFDCFGLGLSGWSQHPSRFRNRLAIAKRNVRDAVDVCPIRSSSLSQASTAGSNKGTDDGCDDIREGKSQAKPFSHRV